MYVNFTGDGDEEKVRASYPAETYARLAAVKAHYDPVNRFRFNQNIRPAPGRMTAAAGNNPGPEDGRGECVPAAGPWPLRRWTMGV